MSEYCGETREPNKEIPAIDLYAAKSGICTKALSGTSGKVLDSEALQNYEARANDLKTEIERARSSNDTVAIDMLTKELEDIGAEISQAKGLGGAIREKSDAEKARKSVGNAISRAIESISKDNASLASHLENSISKGTDLIYSPEKNIEWLT